MQFDGSLVKQPTEALASDPVLLGHLEGKRRTGDHEHACLEYGFRSNKDKLGTLDSSRTVVKGNSDLLREHRPSNDSRNQRYVDSSMEKMFDDKPDEIMMIFPVVEN